MRIYMKSLLLKRKKTIMIMTSVFLLTFVAYTAYASSKVTVVFVKDGREQKVETHTNNVRSFLKEQGVKLDDHDEMSPGPNTYLKENMKITWTPAHQITLEINDQQETIWTTAKTIHNFFNLQHIDVKSHDVVSPSLNEKITDHMTVHYEPANLVNLKDGQEAQRSIWTTAKTVEEFLREQHVNVSKEDRIDPGMDELIASNLTVSVVHVKKVNKQEEKVLPFQTKTKESPDLRKGEIKVLKPGEKGKVHQTYKITYENDKQVSKELIKTEEISQPKDRVIIVGTKTKASATRTVTVTSTAYTADCKGCSGYTKMGLNLKSNPGKKVIAVDPKIIPLGTKVYVEGYGYAIAGDTGGAIDGHKIDIFFPSKHQANNWGRKKVNVTVYR
ncbi:G5 and 3D domain-containing protein [Terrilactibacillus laevilacticus]|uniref:Ubiquitin-like domain-containing protein n=1 Tax=Terrilactibacillus laevilacticus TaxID=1380157 RepID=A0ABW5PRB3_9BACI|nr:G5 and 3D domain-containing protein [Terrilactibacillus laevilacticus]